MRPTVRLWEKASRITFFTSPNCSLCDTAKAVVKKVQARRQFDYVEINIRDNGQEQWMNKYAFDTPVVSTNVMCNCFALLKTYQIHVEAASEAQLSDTTPASQKLMHRFTEDQVESLLNKVGQA